MKSIQNIESLIAKAKSYDRKIEAIINNKSQHSNDQILEMRRLSLLAKGALNEANLLLNIFAKECGK